MTFGTILFYNYTDLSESILNKEEVIILSKIEIRNFQDNDKELLKSFRDRTISNQKTIFWWVGPKENWQNVFCAFENNQMIAKGQVQIVSEIPVGSLEKEAYHQIFLNLKIIPDLDTDNSIYNSMYELLHKRAIELKQSLPTGNKTMLCVGNYSTEEHNNAYFKQRGFEYVKSIFSMQRDLNKNISTIEMIYPYQFRHWDLTTEIERKDYLRVEAEIWPAAPLKLERLIEYQHNPLWRALTVWRDNTLIGSVMVWEEDGRGCIEDLFVRESWRKQGIAKFLLSNALIYLKENGCNTAVLDVETANKSALSLYRSAGFEIVSEEVRIEKEI